MKFKLIIAIAALSLLQPLSSKAEGLVEGAQFIDRFLPLPKGEMSSECWGADNVIPRNISNGIEDAKYSYWGGNIIKGDDGKYHMFVARWPENNVVKKKSGHLTWWSSEVAHAVSDRPTGPYKVVDVVGKGHNPEIYRRKDGAYIIGVLGLKAYKSDNLYGPWTQIPASFTYVNDQEKNVSNRTYIVRQDGSIYMMNKVGGIYLSPKADENFIQQDIPQAYNKRFGSHEEDPTIWEDEVCYNVVMNDCRDEDRIAYYMTSKDGLRWEYEDGIAYTPEDIVVNEDGTREKWFKLERPKVLCDEYGRPTHMNFAAIDITKRQDLANDNHSSKNVVVPMRIARRLELVSRTTKKVSIKLLAEDGFNPKKDVDLKSLHFGNTKLVNYGHGSKVVKSTVSGKDLILEFDAESCGFARDDYKGKLLGKLKNGEPVWGRVRVDVKVELE